MMEPSLTIVFMDRVFFTTLLILTAIFIREPGHSVPGMDSDITYTLMDLNIEASGEIT